MSQDTTAYVDFKEVKRAVSILDVVGHYDIKLTPKGKDKLVGRCPFHDGTSTSVFQVSPSKNAWYCFKCSEGGSQLDFVARMENTDLRGAALLLVEWFNLDESREQQPQPAANGKAEDNGTPSVSGNGYIRTLKEELRTLIREGDEDAIVAYVADKVLESYRNGLQAREN